MSRTSTFAERNKNKNKNKREEKEDAYGRGLLPGPVNMSREYVSTRMKRT